MHVTPQHHSRLGFQILVSLFLRQQHSSSNKSPVFTRMARHPKAQGLISSPPWPGPEPGCQLPAGHASNPIKVTESLLTTLSPALSPALARAATTQEDSSSEGLRTNAKLHTRASAYLGGQCHLQLNSTQWQILLPYRKGLSWGLRQSGAHL